MTRTRSGGILTLRRASTTIGTMCAALSRVAGPNSIRLCVSKFLGWCCQQSLPAMHACECMQCMPLPGCSALVHQCIFAGCAHALQWSCACTAPRCRAGQVIADGAHCKL